MPIPSNSYHWNLQRIKKKEIGLTKYFRNNSWVWGAKGLVNILQKRFTIKLKRSTLESHSLFWKFVQGLRLKMTRCGEAHHLDAIDALVSYFAILDGFYLLKDLGWEEKQSKVWPFKILIICGLVIFKETIKSFFLQSSTLLFLM